MRKVLGRIYTRWVDLEVLFGKHSAHLSEIFWEGLEWVLTTKGKLLKVGLSHRYMQRRDSMYADKIRTKLNRLSNCVGFIDGTVIGIARPSGSYMLQLVSYNGHKRKHSLKFQTVTGPDGLILTHFALLRDEGMIGRYGVTVNWKIQFPSIKRPQMLSSAYTETLDIIAGGSWRFYTRAVTWISTSWLLMELF